MTKFVWIVLIVCLGTLSCTSSAAKKKPIEINRMKLIMWDLIKAGEWHLQILAKDSTIRNKKEDIRLYEQVFFIHGITKDAYFRSYKYYEAHPVEFKVLIDSLDNFSNREKNKLDNHGQAR
jgi:hypothetical protein